MIEALNERAHVGLERSEDCSQTARPYLNHLQEDRELLSFRYVRPFVESLPVLDLGCAQGGYLRQFDEGSMGLDVSQPNVEHCRENGLRVAYGDLNCTLPFASATVPAVFCSHVLEHVDSPVELLRECYRVLSQGGRIVVGLPIEASFVNWIRGENYFRDHPGHLYSFSLTNIDVLLERTGFRTVGIYFEPRIVRTKVWTSLLQKLPRRVAYPLSVAYWILAEKHEVLTDGEI